ncbi:MAG: hypothetical protein J6C85_05090 [Alphaproteobacteria bacterium]|nr:hypothetical protein [Alphaproteobacteria bacterium]
MNLDEFEFLMDKSKIGLNNNGCVSFEARTNKDRPKLHNIIQENQMENLSVDAFQGMVQKYSSLYQVRKKLQQQKIEQFSNMTPQQVAELSLEQKLEYVELLFPSQQTKDELMSVCQKNEENLRACLFNMDFPKSFWNNEKKSADRFVSLIVKQPEITDKMKNWRDTSLDDKKQMIQQVGKIFEYVYQTAPEIVFFTLEDEKAERRSLGLNEDAPISAAYYQNGKIHFNEERLQSSDNFFAVSVMFHEGTHLRQDINNFDNPLVERIFNSNLTNIHVYENEINNRTGDLYTMQPSEIHAYGLQEYVEQQITEKLGIDKVCHADLGKEIKNVHNKAFSIAKLAQYRSK